MALSRLPTHPPTYAMLSSSCLCVCLLPALLLCPGATPPQPGQVGAVQRLDEGVVLLTQPRRRP